jgi:hypothetical protein
MDEVGVADSKDNERTKNFNPSRIEVGLLLIGYSVMESQKKKEKN